jgi:hypothetical protein
MFRHAAIFRSDIRVKQSYNFKNEVLSISIWVYPAGFCVGKMQRMLKQLWNAICCFNIRCIFTKKKS